MPQEEQLTKQEGMIQIWVPKKRMRRPFPLLWGLAALALFAGFAVATQLQFNRFNNEKIYQARLDTYRSDERAYEVALKAHEDCIATIGIRETYRSLFSGISELLQRSADLPLQLFPASEAAAKYQKELTTSIEDLIIKPVQERLPTKKAEECPPQPTDEPEIPRK